jgi:hypothetical protein
MIALFRISLLFVFFLSGASALVYEVVWIRQLALLFGTTTHATTTVLPTFMGGLALRSYGCSRLADRGPGRPRVGFDTTPILLGARRTPLVPPIPHVIVGPR